MLCGFRLTRCPPQAGADEQQADGRSQAITVGVRFLITELNVGTWGSVYRVRKPWNPDHVKPPSEYSTAQTKLFSHPARQIRIATIQLKSKIPADCHWDPTGHMVFFAGSWKDWDRR